MAARKLFRDSTSSSSNTRQRDSIIDELPPDETEKMGYVWVVKGTLTDEEEREAAKFGALPDVNSVPISEISSCNLAKEKVHELIVPDYWGEENVQSDPNPRLTDDFRLYMPSIVRRMHTLFSRPPELIRKDTVALQQVLEKMPAALSDRPSYLQNATRYLDATSRLAQQNGEPSISEQEMEQGRPSAEPAQDAKKEDPSKEQKSEPEEKVKYMKDRDLDAIYADPEIELEETEEPPKPSLPARARRLSEQGEPSKEMKTLGDESDPSSRGRKTQEKEPFIRDYILKKVEDLEKKLKSVNDDIYGSKERQDELQNQLYEMEILKLVEKISKADTPSETDVAKLEYLTDQLKIAQGKKTAEELH